MGIRFSWLRRWARSRKVRFFPDGETYDLQERLEEKQRNIRYLELQLAKTRADKFELEQRPTELRDTIAAILNESVGHLRNAVRFHVRETEPGPGWEVVTDHCCLGGCDLNVYEFPSERDALLFARLLDAVGYQSPHNIACSACYEEHTKACVCNGGEVEIEPVVFRGHALSEGRYEHAPL